MKIEPAEEADDEKKLRIKVFILTVENDKLKKKLSQAQDIITSMKSCSAPTNIPSRERLFSMGSPGSRTNSFD
jgi:hypothetical protein